MKNIMKPIISCLLLAMAIILLFSCGEDDENVSDLVEVQVSDLSGMWVGSRNSAHSDFGVKADSRI